jgi:subtilisin family serine protease
MKPHLVSPARLAACLLLTFSVLASAEERIEKGSERQRREHLTRTGVDRWHQAGFRGKGVKVAILDSGFQGYRDFLGRALPARVTVRSFREDGNLEARESQHGILCGEVIHALAPEAELLFANWEASTPDSFLAAVRWAREQGARVISCSVIVPSWSDGEGGGPVHRELARILGDGSRAGDVLMFCCAGNTAERHWSGAFRDAGRGFHAWQGRTIDNPIQPWGSGRVSIEVCGAAGELELSLWETTTGRLLQRTRSWPGNGGNCAIIRFSPQSEQSYAVRVRAVDGNLKRFHLYVLGGGLGHATAAGSIGFPGDGESVITVGAVDSRGRRVSYSSCGPNSCRPKPDLVACVPFPSLWRQQPFTGTSAADPQAAGLAALAWSRHTSWTARQIREALSKSAFDLGPPGHDHETGHGLIRLPLSR